MSGSWYTQGLGGADELAPEDADSLDDHRGVAIDGFAEKSGRRSLDDRLIEALQPMLKRKMPTADNDVIEDKAITLYQGVVRSAQAGTLPRQTLEMLANLVDTDPDDLLEQLAA